MNPKRPVLFGLFFILVVVLVFLTFFGRAPPRYERLTNTYSVDGNKRTVVALTFGDKVYLEPALRLKDYMVKLSVYNKKTFDCVHCFNLSHIDETFRKKNDWILSQPRGLGYWIWKPYFCLKVWNSLCFGDVLFYVDGGQKISNPEKLQEEIIDQAVRSECGGLMLTQNQTQEEQTKGDVFAYMNIPMEGNKPQLWAGAFAVQKRKSNESFFAEWLSVCEVPNLIDDTPSKAPNHPTFSSAKFRHDQAVFSLIAYKYNFDVRDINTLNTVFAYERPLSYYFTKMKNHIYLTLRG